MNELSNKEILKKVKRKIENGDKLLKMYNIKIDEYDSGYARVSMTVNESHTNAAGVCHGGVIFSLADVAFALASNSHGTLALAIEISISFIGAVKPGTRIIATCKEKHKGRTTGVYSIEITDESGKLISLLKATAFRFKENLV